MVSKENKKAMMDMKDMDRDDWRGVIAVIVLIGGFVMSVISMMLLHPEWFAPIAVLMYAVTDWYFKAQHEKEVEGK